jgi:hypothetical protein
MVQAQQEGRDWYYGDHGFFKRGVYYRITKNAYQPSGEGEASPDRWKALGVPLSANWKRDGRHIVVCPNSPVYMQFHGIDSHAWSADIIRRLAQVSDRPAILRWKKDSQAHPLSLDLVDAWMVVAFSSASAVEALAAGIPVCTLAPWASTARMGITDLEQVEHPYYPPISERDRFLFNLAASQWTLPEIREGIAWFDLCREPVHA